jgi:hypothetical protein
MMHTPRTPPPLREPDPSLTAPGIALPGGTQLAIAIARRELRENNIPTVAEYRLLARAPLRHLALSE